MTVEYKYKGIKSIYPFNIAERKLKPNFPHPSKLRVNGQICQSYSNGITYGPCEPCLINAKLLWIPV